MAKGTALRLGVGLLAAAVCLFVVLRLLSLLGDLSAVPPMRRPGLIAPAFVFYGATLITYALLWREIASRMDGRRPPVVDSISVFCASWLGRFVPSSLPYVAAKFMMGQRIGHSKTSIAASVLYENLLLVGVAAITSSLILPATLFGREAHPLMYVATGLVGLTAIVLLSPPFLSRCVKLAARVARRSPIPEGRLLTFRDIGAASGIAAIGLALNGVCFAFILSAFVDLSVRELVASAVVFNLAGAIGIAVLPVPSGLGVREGVMVALLPVLVPLDVAVASAVVVRLLGVVGDLIFGIAGAGVFAVRHAGSGEHIPNATEDVTNSGSEPRRLALPPSSGLQDAVARPGQRG